MSGAPPSTAVDVRIGRIEADTAHTRDKVDRMAGELSVQGQLMRSLEDNSRATATATIELAALAKAREERERRDEERRAQMETQAAESRQEAMGKVVDAVAQNWKFALLIAVVVLQPCAAEVLRAWGLLPTVAAAPTYIINESVAPPPTAPPTTESTDAAK